MPAREYGFSWRAYERQLGVVLSVRAAFHRRGVQQRRARGRVQRLHVLPQQPRIGLGGAARAPVCQRSVFDHRRKGRAGRCGRDGGGGGASEVHSGGPVRRLDGAGSWRGQGRVLREERHCLLVQESLSFRVVSPAGEGSDFTAGTAAAATSMVTAASGAPRISIFNYSVGGPGPRSRELGTLVNSAAEQGTQIAR